MIRLIVVVLAVGVLLALIWWSAGRPDHGPDGRLSRRYRERGGGWGGGGWGPGR
ncbi:hypothetical protein [Nocardioides sp. GY 10113]|uniref:hypothetical protein n=1 Tax=Nocardioides sp. GY 10113 TaxID=2569761 RepID=UPI0014585235|nr:hypothetical protein [Nocardioides sp. GY 10113]